MLVCMKEKVCVFVCALSVLPEQLTQQVRGTSDLSDKTLKSPMMHLQLKTQ